MCGYGRPPGYDRGYRERLALAAQSGDPAAAGRDKRQRKQVDLVVGNDISRADAGFDSELNEATIIGGDGEERFPLGPKSELARVILDRAERLLEAATTS